jgi:hypothetical protein
MVIDPPWSLGVSRALTLVGGAGAVARVDSGATAAAGVVLVLPAELADAWLAAETVELRAQAGLDKKRGSGWTRRNVVERNPNVGISTSLATLGQ